MAGLQLIRPWYNFITHAVNGIDGELSKDRHRTPSELLEFIKGFKGDKEFFHCTNELEPREGFAGYSNGLSRPAFGLIWVDFDGDPDKGTSLEEAQLHAKTFSAMLKQDGVPHSIFYSGSKGFHITFPAACCMNPEWVEHGHDAKEFNTILKHLTHELNDQFRTVDMAVTGIPQKIRGWNSLNAKSKLFKIRLNTLDKSIEEIQKQAASPQEITSADLDYWLNTKTNISPWLTSLCSSSPKRSKSTGQGGTPKTDPIYSSKNKLCIPRILAASAEDLGDQSRHSVRFTLICDMRDSGVSESDALSKMHEWATRVYAGEPRRIKETEEQVKSLYKSGLYGKTCNDKLKQRFCDAKCELYGPLDPRQRSHDASNLTAKQIKENRAALRETEAEVVAMILETIHTLLGLSGKGEIRKITKPKGFDYYVSGDNKWEKVDAAEFKNKVDACIKTIRGENAKAKEMRDIFYHVNCAIKDVPEVNYLKSIHPTIFNYPDGMREVKHNDKGEYEIIKSPYDPNLFLGHCLPFSIDPNYPDELKRTGLFKKFIEERRGIVHSEEELTFLQEHLGAHLLPFQPSICWIKGTPNSGKSTFAFLGQYLAGHENCCECDPTDIGPYAWTNAMGRAVNIVDELERDSTFNDKMLKRVRNKQPTTIRPIYESPIAIILPPIQTFTSNFEVNLREGGSGAMNERMVILEIHKRPKESVVGNIKRPWVYLWEHDPGGVLDWAREGLQRLIKNKFNYSIPESSVQKIKEMETEADGVALFLRDIETGCWLLGGTERLPTKDNFVIDRETGKVKLRFSKLYESFKNWSDANGQGKNMSAIKFSKRVRNKGLEIGHSKNGKVVTNFFEVTNLIHLAQEIDALKHDVTQDGGGDCHTF